MIWIVLAGILIALGGLVGGCVALVVFGQDAASATGNCETGQ